MLKDNLKKLRKKNGFSQEELSIKLNVVRQTISKWEQGLSVPDAEMLISISKLFQTPVSKILGENIEEKEESDIKVISEKLEVINDKLSKNQNQKRKIFRWILILLGIILVGIFILLLLLNSPYLNWDYNNPEKAVLGVAFHSFEWLFIRTAPILLIVLIVGILLTRRKKKSI